MPLFMELRGHVRVHTIAGCRFEHDEGTCTFSFVTEISGGVLQHVKVARLMRIGPHSACLEAPFWDLKP